MASNQSLTKTENEKFESSLIDRLKNQDDIIEKLQEQVKLLKDNQVKFFTTTINRPSTGPKG